MLPQTATKTHKLVKRNYSRPGLLSLTGKNYNKRKSFIDLFEQMKNQSFTGMKIKTAFPQNCLTKYIYSISAVHEIDLF